MTLIEITALDWQSITTTAIFSLISAGIGTGVTFVAFKAKVTQQILQMQDEIKDMKTAINFHERGSVAEFKSVRSEMDDKIHNCEMNMANQMASINTTLSEIQKNLSTVSESLNYMKGKLDTIEKSNK